MIDQPIAPLAEAPDASAPLSARGPRSSKRKGESTAAPAVVFRGVTKEFGALKAVHDVTFQVPDGSVFGLIGPNGAGKTTTFSMLAGYLSPTSGEILVLDHSPDAVDSLKGKVGVLPQDALLPSQEKVGDFMVFLARLQGIPANDAKAQAGRMLEEVDGSSWWNTKCGALSHGMAKRVGLAQALLGEPKLILLDEPTAGLDPRVAYGVRQLVASRKGKATLIISSHNLQELEAICDYAAILDHGKLVVSDSMSELTASSSELRFELSQGPVPDEAVRAIPGVTTAAFDMASRELVVTFDRRAGDAEDMIGRCLWVLLNSQARISGVAKGRGLEQRVMELTE